MSGPADALLALAHVVEPGDQRLGALADELGPAALVQAIADGSVRNRDADALRARLDDFDAGTARARAAALGARIIHRDERDWPTQLDDLGTSRPFALWVMGTPDLRIAALKSVAMVGARASTPYGEHVARDWSGRLADAGWAVASGGAYGIDAAAHRGVLAVGGVTVCVLATGIDVAYPRAHDELLARIADTGLLISESPLGTQARRQRFLTRNRLIAALTRATVVVEAALRSGTTSTANAAYALNRPVLAVPGPVTSPMSAGCHLLIREQLATVAHSWSDAIELLGHGDAVIHAAAQPDVRATDQLTHDELRVLDAFPSRRPIDLQSLMRAAGLGLSRVLSAVGTLEALGFIEGGGDHWRLARGRAALEP